MADLSLASIFLALIAAPNALATDFALPRPVDDDAIGQFLPTVPPIPVGPPGAGSLPMLIRREWRAAAVIGIADAHRAQEYSQTHAHEPMHKAVLSLT
jgi:hypothetical protein